MKNIRLSKKKKKKEIETVKKIPNRKPGTEENNNCIDKVNREF